jgi:hypothetical protein
MTITNAVAAFALTVGLAAASTARADDPFADAHEHMPVANAEQDASRQPLALTPNRQQSANVEQNASRLPLALTPNRQQSASRDEGVTYPLPDSDPEIQRLLSQ